MRQFWCSAAAVMAGVAMVASVARGAADPVREGVESHREATGKLELKPFDHALWSSLKDWKNGMAPTATETGGKVVLVLLYSDYSPASKPAAALAARLSEKYADQGLVAVLAHNDRGWSEAEKTPPKSGDLRFAHDAKNALRAALLSDGDPDFYLIDRSGQVRFADITTESVESAVQALVGEAADVAAGTKARLADAAAKADAERRKTRSANDSVDLTKIPELPFTPPAPDAYEKANWPKMPRDETKREELAYLEPREVELAETNWYPKKPETKGRVVVVYFFHPRFSITYENLMPLIDRLQRRYGRDVVFVGAAFPFDAISNVRLLKEDKDPEKLAEMIEKFVKGRQFDHYLTVDADKAMYQAIHKKDSEEELLPPMLGIITSDGYARWWQSKAVVNWEAALDQMVANDPGVRARRAAEQDWIRKNAGK
jgi:thiol-disulfide isomerase/thioredoxin